MTVAQLIEQLQRMDPSLLVVRALSDGSYVELDKDLYEPQLVKLTFSSAHDCYYQWDEDGEIIWGVTI